MGNNYVGARNFARTKATQVFGMDIGDAMLAMGHDQASGRAKGKVKHSNLGGRPIRKEKAQIVE